MNRSLAVILTATLLAAPGALAPASAREAPAASASAPAGEVGPIRVVVPFCHEELASPRLVTDGDGVSTAVWGCESRIFAARSRADGTWRPAVELGAGLAPKAVVDTQGRATVVYRMQHGAGMVSRRWTDGSWQPAVDITMPSRADVVFVQLEQVQANARGDIVVLWSQNNGEVQSGDTPKLVAAYRPFDGPWQVGVRVGPKGYARSAAIDGSGRVWVLNVPDVWRRTPAGRWLGPTSTPFDDIVVSGATASDGGDLLLTARPVGGDPRPLVAYEKPFGDPWLAGVQLGDHAGVGAPALLDDDGQAIVVFRGPQKAVWSVSRAAGGSWEAPVLVSATQVGPSHFRLVRGPDGMLALGWLEGTYDHYTLWVSVRPAGGDWAAPVQVAGLRWQHLRHPTVTVEPDGVLLAAWQGRVEGHPGWRMAARSVTFAG